MKDDDYGQDFPEDIKPQAQDTEVLQKRIVKLEETLNLLNFKWTVFSIVLFDTLTLTKADNLSAPIVIGLFQFVVLLIISRKLGIKDINLFIDTILEPFKKTPNNTND